MVRISFFAVRDGFKILSQSGFLILKRNFRDSPFVPCEHISASDASLPVYLH